MNKHCPGGIRSRNTVLQAKEPAGAKAWSCESISRRCQCCGLWPAGNVESYGRVMGGEIIHTQGPDYGDPGALLKRLDFIR